MDFMSILTYCIVAGIVAVIVIAQLVVLGPFIKPLLIHGLITAVVIAVCSMLFKSVLIIVIIHIVQLIVEYKLLDETDFFE